MASTKFTQKKSPKKSTQKKCTRKVLNLALKLEILNSLKKGVKIVQLAWKFRVGESTIRSIRENEAKIRESAQILGASATEKKIISKPGIEKMEQILYI